MDDAQLKLAPLLASIPSSEPVHDGHEVTKTVTNPTPEDCMSWYSIEVTGTQTEAYAKVNHIHDRVDDVVEAITKRRGQAPRVQVLQAKGNGNHGTIYFSPALASEPEGLALLQHLGAETCDEPESGSVVALYRVE